ncbi:MULTISPECIES: OmpP1/FadL family transporter [unclassified Janthinobacterium]|uniref:OmpP1/FadL family transporter n=1 Tax=unclassified Janthinobacterium TaxID=2610881 RepID=UPI000344C240|nr:MULTISPECIES: OmpP1/FadL family transporter [unclassified Janthinobacterium]MEC5160650.1 long-chain fatty acid transport protein [Janthinobacterium sp. CG_S6]
MKYKYLPLIIASALGAMSATAHASGYRFGSQSVASQGTADANAAEANDASTVFYNPAGLSRLEGSQFSGGATVVVPHSTFTDTGSSRFNVPAVNYTGASTGGTAAKDYTPEVVVAPSIYASKKINEQWSVGAGLFVPYGAKLDYGNTWTGRYALTSIKLESIALNPSLAFKLDQHHSFGFGVSAEHMKAELAQAVDVPGGVRFLGQFAPAGSTAFLRGIAQREGLAAAGAAGLALRNAGDGHASMDGDDWGFGYNLGYLYQANQSTRFGVAYRSSVKHKLTGKTIWDFSNASNNAAVNQFLSANSGKVNSEVLVELRTPETLSVNVFHQIDAQWAAMADLTWTRNSRLQNLDIQFPPTAQGAERIRQEWNDTYRLALGGNYRYSDKLLLRGGFAYDQAPTRSPELTHPALPDSDRYQFSLGANWKLSANSSIDAAYSFLQFKDANMNYTNACSPINPACTGNGETTRGQYQTRLQLLGVAYNYKF